MSGVVLFGDDGSASADLAWMWICAQPWDGWRIDVLTASGQAMPDAHAAQRWQPPRPRELPTPPPAAALRQVRSGLDPRLALLEHPAKDLIVVGPRGRGLFKALHLGSTAEWLMHDPPAPLLIARRGRQVRTAMVCSDGSSDALAAARAFATMPWLPQVDVTAVSVQQVGLDHVAAADQAAALFAGRARSVTAAPVAPDETDVFFDVRGIILSLLRAHDTDLLVLGTQGLSAWAAMRAGSIATSLAAHAPCSVFLVHNAPSVQA